MNLIKQMLWLFTASAALGETPATLAPELRGKIDTMVRQVLSATGVPSASVAIVEQGRIAYVRAYGDARLEPRKACRVYVGLLHLAAMHGCEAALADHLAAVLDAGGTPDLEAARAAVAPPALASAPVVSVPAPDLAGYDRLLTHLGEAA